MHKLNSELIDLYECRTKVIFIPKGLKSMLQPLDVSINKPVKVGLLKKYIGHCEVTSEKIKLPKV